MEKKKNNEIYVSFPNEGEYSIDVDIVKKWDISEPKEIGDSIFFWSGGLYLAMNKKDFKNIFNTILGE